MMQTDVPRSGPGVGSGESQKVSSWVVSQGELPGHAQGEPVQHEPFNLHGHLPAWLGGIDDGSDRKRPDDCAVGRHLPGGFFKRHFLLAALDDRCIGVEENHDVGLWAPPPRLFSAAPDGAAVSIERLIDDGVNQITVTHDKAATGEGRAYGGAVAERIAEGPPRRLEKRRRERAGRQGMRAVGLGGREFPREEPRGKCQVDAVEESGAIWTYWKASMVVEFPTPSGPRNTA